MPQERRLHPRLAVKDLKAHITISRSSEETIDIEGQVIDISYTGIKISLDSPLPMAVEGLLKIVIILPQSRIPLTIHGEIRHMSPGLNCGMQYIESSSEENLDRLMFECVRISHTDPNGDDYLKRV